MYHYVLINSVMDKSFEMTILLKIIQEKPLYSMVTILGLYLWRLLSLNAQMFSNTFKYDIVIFLT